MLFSAGRTADGRSLIPWGDKSKPGCRQLPGRHDDDCPAKENVQKYTATRNNKQQTIGVWRISQKRSMSSRQSFKTSEFHCSLFFRETRWEKHCSHVVATRSLESRRDSRPHVAVLQCERDDGSKTSETDSVRCGDELKWLGERLHWQVTINNWLVVLTILKNMSMGRMTSPILWKIKNVWNHQPDKV